MNDPSIILDASAWLAFINREPGHKTVAAYVTEGSSAISAINAAEAISKQTAIGILPEDAMNMFRLLNVRIIPFGDEDAIACGSSYPTTRASGLSLGNHVCLGLASRLNVPVMTADRAWSHLDLSVEVIQIR
jgi:ribonuclease VapC